MSWTDYDAEWAQELEVLESILTPEELESMGRTSSSIQCSIIILMGRWR